MSSCPSSPLQNRIADGFLPSLWCVFLSFGTFRILDVEWAIEHSKPNVIGSPKRGKKGKGRKGKAKRDSIDEEPEEDQMEIDEVATALGELTNMGRVGLDADSASVSKRSRDDVVDYDTPAKRPKKMKKAVAQGSEDEDYEFVTPKVAAL